jgi:hypothetical protein
MDVTRAASLAQVQCQSFDSTTRSLGKQALTSFSHMHGIAWGRDISGLVNPYQIE